LENFGGKLWTEAGITPEMGGISLGPRQFPITVGRLILIHCDSFGIRRVYFSRDRTAQALY
jgi:hypothetical protein